MEWNEIISLIVGIIVGGTVRYFWGCLTLTHEYKLKTISDRIDEFVKDSKKYFGPLALASGDLARAFENYKTLKETERVFYRLSQYIYQRDVLRENTYFYFPSKDKERDVIAKYDILNITISKIFENDQKCISRISNYYSSNKEYNAFCDKLSTLSNEFTIFESKINESEFKDELEKTSDELCTLIMDAITMSYESWYNQHKSFYRSTYSFYRSTYKWIKGGKKQCK